MDNRRYNDDTMFSIFLMESAVISTKDAGEKHMWVPNEVRTYTKQHLRFHLHEPQKQKLFKEKMR